MLLMKRRRAGGIVSPSSPLRCPRGDGTWLRKRIWKKLADACYRKAIPLCCSGIPGSYMGLAMWMSWALLTQINKPDFPGEAGLNFRPFVSPLCDALAWWPTGTAGGQSLGWRGAYEMECHLLGRFSWKSLLSSLQHSSRISGQPNYTKANVTASQCHIFPISKTSFPLRGHCN